MGRSKISSAGKDLITDDGSVLVSIARGEQLHQQLTFKWLTDLTGYTMVCTITEGVNDGQGGKPTGVKPSGVSKSLAILDDVSNDNKVVLVFPENLAEGFSPQPKPDMPVYAYIDFEIADTGVGPRQQIWKPFRGLVELLYSPTDI